MTPLSPVPVAPGSSDLPTDQAGKMMLHLLVGAKCVLNVIEQF